MFGPISLKGLQQDRFQRITTGKLPAAEVAFVEARTEEQGFRASDRRWRQVVGDMRQDVTRRRSTGSRSCWSTSFEMLCRLDQEVPMTVELENLIAQAQRLPSAERLRLIAALTEQMSIEADIEVANSVFRSPRSVDQHLVEQGVGTPQDFEALAARGIWPEDEELDEFLEDLEDQRRHEFGNRHE